ASDGVALHAAADAKEDERAALLFAAHRVAIASGELINRRIGKRQRELELGNCATEHLEVDRGATSHFGEHRPEQAAIHRDSIHERDALVPDGFIAETRFVGARNDLAFAVVELTLVLENSRA